MNKDHENLNYICTKGTLDFEIVLTGYQCKSIGEIFGVEDDTKTDNIKTIDLGVPKSPSRRKSLREKFSTLTITKKQSKKVRMSAIKQNIDKKP